MKPILLAGTIIVNFALISYAVGIITEQIKRKVTVRVLWFLTVGVILDITATACMIIGSSNSPFTLHGILGYSSLTAMLIDTILVWRHRGAHGEGEVGKGLHWYSRLAYIWWLLAYATGALLVFLARP